MIHIQAEVKSRELARGLLLAAKAARFGYSSLVGPTFPFLEYPSVRPALVHLNSGPTEALERFASTEGIPLTAQDEESPVAIRESDFVSRTPVRLAVGSESLRAFFTWGETEERYLRKAGKDEILDRSVSSGGVRGDFWRDDFADYFGIPDFGVAAPFVLLASPFGYLLRERPPWGLFESFRSFVDGPEWKNQRSARLHKIAEGWILIRRFIDAVERLVAAYPRVTFVLRPHPAETWGAWDGLLEGHQNLIIRRDMPVGHWIRKAAVTVHLAETVGIESAHVRGARSVAYCPDGVGGDMPAAQLGSIVTSDEQLIETVGRFLADVRYFVPPAQDIDWTDYIWNSDRARADAPTASDRVVETWASIIGRPQRSAMRSIDMRRLALAEERRLSRKRRRRLRSDRKMAVVRPTDPSGSELVMPKDLHEPDLKFTPLTAAEIEEHRQRLARLDPELGRATFRKVSSLLVLVTPGRGSAA